MLYQYLKNEVNFFHLTIDNFQYEKCEDIDALESKYSIEENYRKIMPKYEK